MKAQRFSHQREMICQMVAQSREHPTAQEVYDVLKPEMPQLSLGTVYRNLRQLAEDGKVMEIAGTPVRYDAITTGHSHFRCNCCGRVSDLHNIPYDSLLDRAAGQNGCIITGHELMFNGICSVCAEKQ